MQFKSFHSLYSSFSGTYSRYFFFDSFIEIDFKILGFFGAYFKFLGKI
ncbi:Putative protein [Zobellia galactanivorans]|uniref:Uncharacterized protein n=1 Tax=Zobellia galactanivorans (strain DSM 12802 / CCUG 47099 / CIP 106680 / NCIMB 13871 / Dsij) TaxID=63186 RepID=G0L1G7_ZOBGA|nr:Putative protein [Zobellia galactanivorans]